MKLYFVAFSTIFLASCGMPPGDPVPTLNITPVKVSGIETAKQGLGYCSFSKNNLSFEGSPVDQALCLLTPVKRYAHLGEPLKRLPTTLQKLMSGTEELPSRGAAAAYLSNQGIEETMVGGPITGPIAQTRAGKPALYFVLHDTSSPYYQDGEFPENLNENARVNSFKGYDKRRAAHLFINRVGVVRQYHNFDVPWRATKLENKVVGVASRGRFIHIELIQPRRRDPKGGAKNDAIAPLPGFTAIQYTRLAQAYVVASVRAERWLIPAYHTALDSGLKDGHDDPQNFDLPAWDKAVSNVLRRIK